MTCAGVMCATLVAVADDVRSALSRSVVPSNDDTSTISGNTEAYLLPWCLPPVVDSQCVAKAMVATRK